MQRTKRIPEFHTERPAGPNRWTRRDVCQGATQPSHQAPLALGVCEGSIETIHLKALPSLAIALFAVRVVVPEGGVGQLVGSHKRSLADPDERVGPELAKQNGFHNNYEHLVGLRRHGTGWLEEAMDQKGLLS
jgi:hypothetical protein